MYKCECGREFEKLGSFRSHRRFCDLHEHHKKYESKSIYKINDNLYRCECGQEFENHGRLAGHFNYCQIHCDAVGKEPTIRKSSADKMNIWWKNRSVEDKRKSYDLMRKTLKEKYEKGEIIPAFLGRHHSPETKQKMREHAIKRIGYSANFSKKACNFIDNLNKEKGWNLQHALNGGEKIVKGYYLDGYDKNLNIVFEYDEPSHYIDIDNNILKSKDQERQDIIIETLGCKFFRYNEKKNELYEAKIEDNFYLYIEEAIKDNKIDYTSRTTIKNSLKKIGLSIKKFDVYLDKHPEVKDELVNKEILKKEKNQTKKERREEENKKKTERKLQKAILSSKREEEKIKAHIRHLNEIKRREELLTNIKDVIKNIDLDNWGKVKRLRDEIKKEFNKDVSPKQIRHCLKSLKEFDLLDSIFGKNENYSKQCWVSNKDTKEIKRIPENELSTYLDNGWIRGRKIPI